MSGTAFVREPAARGRGAGSRLGRPPFRTSERRLPFCRSVRLLDHCLDQEHPGRYEPAGQHEIAQREPRVGVATIDSAGDQASEAIAGGDEATLEGIRNDRAWQVNGSELPD